MSRLNSANEAPTASRLAWKTSARDPLRDARSGRTTARHRRLIRLRTFARGETFFDTTQTALLERGEGEGATVRKKYSPPSRRRGIPARFVKSSRANRCFFGIGLRGEPRTTLPASTRQEVTATCTLRAMQKTVGSRALSLFWLPCSFHDTTIPVFLRATTPSNDYPHSVHTLCTPPAKTFPLPLRRRARIMSQLLAHGEYSYEQSRIMAKRTRAD